MLVGRRGPSIVVIVVVVVASSGHLELIFSRHNRLNNYLCVDWQQENPKANIESTRIGSRLDARPVKTSPTTSDVGGARENPHTSEAKAKCTQPNVTEEIFSCLHSVGIFDIIIYMMINI